MKTDSSFLFIMHVDCMTCFDSFVHHPRTKLNKLISFRECLRSSRMAARYLSAIDLVNAEYEGLTRQQVNREPLADVYAYHNIVPDQPQYSFKSVEAGIGERTYKPRTTAEVVQLQHKRLHDFLVKNRNIRSGSANRRQFGAFLRKRPETTRGSRVNSAKSQSGENKRPKSAAVTPSVKTVKPAARPQTSLPKRREAPSTSTKPASPPQPSNGGLICLSDLLRKATSRPATTNRELLESREACTRISSAIKSHLHQDPVHLKQGKFARGGGGGSGSCTASQLDPEAQWLSFGGGRSDKGSAGIIEAFAGMKALDDYYNIEGETGSRVAQMLRRGDRIRIGVNGNVINPSWEDPMAAEGFSLLPDDVVWDREGSPEKRDDTPESVVEESLVTEREEREDQESKPCPSLVSLGGTSMSEARPTLNFMKAKARDEAEARMTPREKRLEKLKKLREPLNWGQQVERPDVSVKGPSSPPPPPPPQAEWERHQVVFHRVLPEQCIPTHKLTTPVYYHSPRDNKTSAPDNKASGVTRDLKSAPARGRQMHIQTIGDQELERGLTAGDLLSHTHNTNEGRGYAVKSRVKSASAGLGLKGEGYWDARHITSIDVGLPEMTEEGEGERPSIDDIVTQVVSANSSRAASAEPSALHVPRGMPDEDDGCLSGRSAASSRSSRTCSQPGTPRTRQVSIAAAAAGDAALRVGEADRPAHGARALSAHHSTSGAAPTGRAVKSAARLRASGSSAPSIPPRTPAAGEDTSYIKVTSPLKRPPGGAVANPPLGMSEDTASITAVHASQGTPSPVPEPQPRLMDRRPGSSSSTSSAMRRRTEAIPISVPFNGSATNLDSDRLDTVTDRAGGD